MVGIGTLSSLPVSDAAIRRLTVDCSTESLSFTTYDATISGGASVSIDIVPLSAFSDGYDGEAFGTGIGDAELQYATYDAFIQTNGLVLADTDTVTFTTYPAKVQQGGAIFIDTKDELTYTTYDSTVSTGGYVGSDSYEITFTTYDVTIESSAYIFAEVSLNGFTEYNCSISISGLVTVSPATVAITTHDASVVDGVNPKWKIESQKFSPSNLITLFELDSTNLGGEYSRFTSSAKNDDFISFGGNSYLPIPIEAEGFEVSGKGTLPTPTLRVLNTPALQSAVIAMDDILGATLYRIRTFRTFLDDGDDPNPNATFPIDKFKVERKVSQNKVYIEWELSASIDQEGKMIPARQIIRDYCTHIYRTYNEETGSFDYTKATCPYVGGNYYDENNSPTNIAQDKCGKRLSSCKLRFGNNAELPTRAFPGVARIR